MKKCIQNKKTYKKNKIQNSNLSIVKPNLHISIHSSHHMTTNLNNGTSVKGVSITIAKVLVVFGFSFSRSSSLLFSSHCI